MTEEEAPSEGGKFALGQLVWARMGRASAYGSWPAVVKASTRFLNCTVRYDIQWVDGRVSKAIAESLMLDFGEKFSSQFSRKKLRGIAYKRALLTGIRLAVENKGPKEGAVASSDEELLSLACGASFASDYARTVLTDEQQWQLYAEFVMLESPMATSRSARRTHGCTVTGCGQYFGTGREAAEHADTAHLGWRLRCIECGLDCFATPAAFLVHLAYAHPQLEHSFTDQHTDALPWFRRTARKRRRVTASSAPAVVGDLSCYFCQTTGLSGRQLAEHQDVGGCGSTVIGDFFSTRFLGPSNLPVEFTNAALAVEQQLRNDGDTMTEFVSTDNLEPLKASTPVRQQQTSTLDETIAFRHTQITASRPVSQQFDASSTRSETGLLSPATSSPMRCRILLPKLVKSETQEATITAKKSSLPPWVTPKNSSVPQRSSQLVTRSAVAPPQQLRPISAVGGVSLSSSFSSHHLNGSYFSWWSGFSHLPLGSWAMMAPLERQTSTCCPACQQPIRGEADKQRHLACPVAIVTLE